MIEKTPLSPVERFQNLLSSYQDEDGEYKYRKRLSQMAILGTKSIIVDFEDLLTIDFDLATNIIDQPDDYLQYSQEAAKAQLKIEDPEYVEDVDKICVMFRGLPDKTQLRKMGSQHIGKLIFVDGILVRASSIRPFLTHAVFKCRRCENESSLEQAGTFILFPPFCSACQRTGPFDIVETKSEFVDSQEIRVQERPEDLPPGQLPRWVDVRLIDDLVDKARPGDRVTITGIVRTRKAYLPRRGTLRMFDVFLETNFIDIAGKEPEITDLSPEEENWMKDLSKDPSVHEKIVQSIAPSVYGYPNIKEAIMYLLFGGVQKHLPDGITIRGDSNILIIGDPGTAKSVLLQYVTKIAPRGLYTSGRGSTAVGLTAAVIRDKSGGMTLEAGALVLADRGICAIDEMDKMREDDRVAIHEAMEQQTVSIAKGGIVATLNARTAILAAANPALGRYDPFRTVVENINLPVTILSRFDLIFIIRDEPNKEVDSRLAEHILAIHRTGRAPVNPPIPPQMLRKYISYAKRINPILTDEAMNRLKEFYLQMRNTESSDSPIAITARQLEGLIRLSEARARASLRKEILVEDAQAAIILMKKSLEQVGIDLASGKFDIDILMTGKPKSVRDKLQVLISIIVEAEKTVGMIREGALYERLETEYDIQKMEASKLLNQLIKDGMIYSPRPGYFKKT